MAGSIGAIVITLLIGILALLHNKDFRQYVLQIAQTKLTEAVGIDFRMRDFSVHWSGLSPSVDMFDVVIAGAPPYQAPPVLHVDHLRSPVMIGLPRLLS